MKLIISLLIVVILVGCSDHYQISYDEETEQVSVDVAYPLIENSIHIVPAWEWVTVKNPDPISSKNNEFGWGETCGISKGGTVMILEDLGVELLVVYTTPENRPSAGTPCPTGVIFYIDREKFRKWERTTERINMNPYYEREKAKQEMRDKLAKLKNDPPSD